MDTKNDKNQAQKHTPFHGQTDGAIGQRGEKEQREGDGEETMHCESVWALSCNYVLFVLYFNLIIWKGVWVRLNSCMIKAKCTSIE